MLMKLYAEQRVKTLLVSSHGGAAQLLLLMRRNHTSVQPCIHSMLTMMTTMLMRVIIIYINLDTILPKMRRTGVYLYSLHPFHFVGHVYDGDGDHHLHHHCHTFLKFHHHSLLGLVAIGLHNPRNMEPWASLAFSSSGRIF